MPIEQDAAIKVALGGKERLEARFNVSDLTMVGELCQPKRGDG